MELIELFSDSAFNWSPVICTVGCVVVGAGGCLAICALDGPVSFIADAKAFSVSTSSQTGVGAIVAGFAS